MKLGGGSGDGDGAGASRSGAGVGGGAIASKVGSSEGGTQQKGVADGEVSHAMSASSGQGPSPTLLPQQSQKSPPKKKEKEKDFFDDW